MSSTTEGILAIVAAVLVLLSAVIDPTISFIISTASLVGIGVFHLTAE